MGSHGAETRGASRSGECAAGGAYLIWLSTILEVVTVMRSQVVRHTTLI
jgi:hypothetical protein